MYEWISKKSNQTARNMILLLFAGSAVLLGLTVVLPDVPFRWVFQLIALGLLTAGVFLVTRYLTKLFIYRIIEDGEGGYDLTVTEAASNGKRAVTVCRIGIGQIRSVRLLDFSDGGETQDFWKQFQRGRRKVHDYRTDLRPTRSLLLTVSEGEEELYLLLSEEDGLYEVLNRWEGQA